MCCATWEAQEKRTEVLEKLWRTVTPEIVRDFIFPYLLRFCFTVKNAASDVDACRAWLYSLETHMEKITGYHGPEKTSIADLDSKGPFPAGSANSAYARYFDGLSYLTPVSTSQVGVYVVSFEPGCRNHWHTHKATAGGGQILVVTAGRGYYQEWGKQAQELHPGDVVHIPPNVKHWHGAACDSAFQHLALEVPGKDTTTVWEEPVESADYAKLP